MREREKVTRHKPPERNATATCRHDCRRPGRDVTLGNTFDAASIRQLQRLAGNKAVARLLSPEPVLQRTLADARTYTPGSDTDPFQHNFRVHHVAKRPDVRAAALENHEARGGYPDLNTRSR